MSTLIETTIAANYVQDWSVFEGIREIMQNALDAHDQGHKMNITYIRKERTLVISNEGAKLKKSNLLLGSTSKCNDNTQRGQYGEGFKIGSLALVREGKPVTIHNDEGYWECLIEYSESYDSNVLYFNIIKNSKLCSKGKLIFKIANIEPKEWKNLRDKFLNVYLPDSKLTRKSPHGTVFKDKNIKGKVYCGGIYIATDKELGYGYDFKPGILELNRDRNMVDSFDLNWNTSKIWAYLAANSKGELYNTKNMLKSNLSDVKYMDNFTDFTVKDTLVQDFLKENGPKAFPVQSEEEAKEVRSMGYNPIFSSSSYAGAIKCSLGHIDDLRKTVELDYTSFQNITPIDDANIQWVFEVLFALDSKFKLDIRIAKFEIETTRSIVDKKVLVINSNLLISKFDILHEVIRYYAEIKELSATHIWKKILQQTLANIEVN